MLTKATIDRVVAAALEEDAPWGDLTSEYLIVETATARADLVAREDGVFSGGDVFAAAFRLTDPRDRRRARSSRTASGSRRAPCSPSSPVPRARC